jgi:hypothetical protein
VRHGWHCRAMAALASGPLVLMPLAADAAGNAVVDAGPPTDYSVTIYRAPEAQDAALDVDALQGFALISEQRSITIPAGESTIRFPAVANGIRATTAVLSGVPSTLLEMNRDARVLGPLELIQSAVGQTVILARTDRHSGAVTRVAATIRGGDQGSVVFETAQGVEALHCTGVAEQLTFSAGTDLGATPTLSVRVRSAEPVTTVATLSYLSDGFDWRADYVARLSADEKLLDLGGWVTLGNSNAAGFASAHTQVIAGQLNHVAADDAPLVPQESVIAQCWPSGTTSDLPLRLPVSLAMQKNDSDAGEMTEIVVTSRRALPAAMALPASGAVMVQQEQLGDLKLYRVPEATDIASHQMKQVRLLDRHGIPVESFYRVDLDENTDTDSFPARKMLRTRNDEDHHLGLPLPTGHIVVTTARHDQTLLLSEAPMRDVARDEQLEIDLGDSADVRVQPGPSGIDISNARARPSVIELHLHLPDGVQLIEATPAAAGTAAEPLIKLTVAANASASVHLKVRMRPQTGRQ